MNRNRVITSDENVTHVDFEGLQSHPWTRGDKVRAAAAAAGVVAVSALGFQHMNNDPTSPPVNNDPSISRNLEHGRQIMVTENRSEQQVIEVHTSQPGPADIPAVSMPGNSADK